MAISGKCTDLSGLILPLEQAWEQGWRKPRGPVAELLRIAEQKRKIFTELLDQI